MKAIFLVGFIFGTVTLGQTFLLGAKECTYGPAYWCGSLKNAKQCGAMKHCIQTVWEKQTLPSDNDDVCKICKDMVKEARDQLLSNETQEDIRAVFEGSCKLIPITLIQDECIKVSDEFIPELIETLASQMNPQIVCATAGLCNSAKIDKLLAQAKNHIMPIVEKEKTESAPAQDCKDCKTFVADVIQEARSISRSEVLDHLLAVCGQLGSFSDGCMSLVQTNFNMIYDFLTQFLQPGDFCDFIGMCERMFGKTHTALSKSGDMPCDFCLAIVNNWRNNLVANTTMEEFKQILDGICEHTGSFKSECLSLVDQYFEVAYDIIISEMDPKEICEAVGLCGVNALFKHRVPIWTVISMKPEDHLPQSPVRPSIDFTGRDEANAIKKVHLPRVTLTKSIKIVSLGEKGVLTEKRPEYKFLKNDECVMCEFVLHFLQNELNEKNTREELIQAMDSVCNMFPKSVAQQCQDYVDAYGDQLIQMIILEIDPSTVCPMIHMCPGENLHASLDIDTTCLLCEYVMTELDTLLSDKTTQDEVKAALESVCTVMPKSIQSECTTFIDNYFDQIVDLIVHGVTPKQICTQLGLCPNGKKQAAIDAQTAQLPVSRLFVPLPVSEPKPKVGGKQSITCVLCEFIVSRIDPYILSNSTEKSIEEIFDEVCLLMPSTLKNDCLGFMEDYGKPLIEILVADLQPEYVCSMLKLCISNINEGMWKAQVELPVDKCLVCEEVLQFIEHQAKDGEIVDLVDNLLNKVCDNLPKPSKTECYEMVTNYGQFLVKLLEELSDAKHVCQAIKMCPYQGGKQLLGAKKCTWGPSYWCQSQMHATACKATKHCSDKVWIDMIPAF